MRHERLQLERRGSSQQQGKRESTKYVQGFQKKGCVESSGVVAGEEYEKIGAGSKKYRQPKTLSCRGIKIATSKRQVMRQRWMWPRQKFKKKRN
jgi:hypothetical protein